MNTIKINNLIDQKYKWLIKVALWALAIMFAASYSDVVLWLLDMGIVFLVYHAWKFVRKDVPATVSLISLAVILAAFTVEWSLEYLIHIIIFLAPVFVIYLVGLLIRKGQFSFAHNPGDIEKKVNLILWIYSVFAWIYTFNYMVNTLKDINYASSVWDPFLMAALPIIYAVFFREIADIASRNQKNIYLKVAAIYFLVCLAILILINGVIYREYPYSRMNWEPDKVIYMVLLAVIVCVSEMKNTGINVSIKDKTRTFIFSGVYVVMAGLLTFFGNDRLRTVIYNIGGPAVDVQGVEREDWILYRINLIKSYFSGNMKDDYMSSSWIGSLAAKFGYVALIIALMALFILVLALIFRKWKDNSLNLMKNYLAISYLLRGGLIILYCLLVLPISNLSFPFFSSSVITFDLMILYYLFKENRLRKADA